METIIKETNHEREKRERLYEAIPGRPFKDTTDLSTALRGMLNSTPVSGSESGNKRALKQNRKIPKLKASGKIKYVGRFYATNMC